METQLVKMINESGLEQSQAAVLIEKFSDYQEIASEWKAKAEMLVVTREDQTKEMALAREGRLFLQKKRTAIESTRKELKERSLREGKAIDAIAKMLTALIEPIEKDLEGKEKFAERQAAARKEAVRQEREKRTGVYREFFPINVNLADYSEDEFVRMLAHAKEGYDKKVEQDRLAAEENERIRKENEELRIKAAEQQRIIDEQNREKQKKLEIEQKKSTGSDKEKLVAVMKELREIKFPQMDSEAGAQIMNDTQILVEKTCTFIYQKLFTL